MTLSGARKNPHIRNEYEGLICHFMRFTQTALCSQQRRTCRVVCLLYSPRLAQAVKPLGAARRMQRMLTAVYQP